MRILIVSQYFWPESFKVNDLAVGLLERGHAVDVLTGMPNYPSGRYFDGYRPWRPLREDYRGVAVLRLPIFPRGDGRAWRLALNYASYALLGAARVAAVRRRRWDVAVVYEVSPVTQVAPAAALRARARVPVAVWVQDLWPESVTASGLVRSPLLLGGARHLSRWLYGSADLLLGSSEAFVPRLRAMGIPAERIRYMPQWAEELYTAPSSGRARSERAAWEDGFPVMFAGNLGRVQSLETVVEAADLLRDDPHVRWVLVGDGSLRPWIEQEVRRRSLEERVVLVGRQPVEAMPGLFARAGALLVALKPDEIMSLTVPSKLQTYFAAGRPVLGSIDGEAARIIEQSGSGFTAPAGDARALADIAQRMARLAPAERERMGQLGREYYARYFDREACLDAWERTLVELAERGAS